MKQLMKRPLIRLAKHLSKWQDVIHQHSVLETARQRLALAMGLVVIGFVVIGGRLVDVMVIRSGANQQTDLETASDGLSIPRADILDRNGEVLATHLVTASVYANPKVILNPREAALKLSKLLPHVGYTVLLQRLTSQKGFIWLARHVPPKLQQEINHLGVPGVYLKKDYKRVYPYGQLVSHVLGYCGIDNNGLSGVEKFFDVKLQNDKSALKLSVDVRIQHIVHDELTKAISEFRAVGGNAMVMDLKTGEVVAMVSLPDFDPNLPNQNDQKATFNRNTLGVYEPGSIFKVLNVAIALESGTASLRSVYDATSGVKIGRFTVTDFRGKNRELSLAEAFIYSSNIAAIKMAQQFGTQTQKMYMDKFGIFKPTTVEVPEIGQPLVPVAWSSATTMTVSYGYGVSVTPLQALTTIAGVINNGHRPKPTLIYKDKLSEIPPSSDPIVSEKTSQTIRTFMRINAKEGPGKRADQGKFKVFAKTGTAYQAKHGNYGAVKTRTNSCVGGFPYDNPRYVFLVVLDDPQPTKTTYGFAAAGWNAAPTAGKMVARMAPILGVQPAEEDEEETTAPGWTSVKHTNGGND
ncbi:peptidoglycan D,D-transpeptidase FtsI family protein [Candidatus Finniella inopinata]|nr:penicillin-binding protein 2 [Candidatus Finniella inopinata]